MSKKSETEGNNICRFVHTGRSNVPLEINPVNFVWERSDVREKENIYSVFSLMLVVRGAGTLVLDGCAYPIKQGDMFFTHPSSLLAVKNGGDLEYAYISFLGTGAPELLKRVEVQKEPVFHGCDELIEFWEKAIGNVKSENVDFISRGVLFYSVAQLIRTEADSDGTNVIASIIDYVKLNFTDPKLSLQSLADRFGYNVKYLSKFFLAHTGVKYSDYIANLRINAACAMLSEGNTPIKEIAYRCGFHDALYFSRVFKSRMLLSPLEFQKTRSKGVE